MLAYNRIELEIYPVFPFFHHYMAQGHCICTYASFSKPFSSPTKVIVYKFAVSYFYKTEFKILAALGWLAVLKISAIILKYPTFEGDLFMFSYTKQIQN